MASYVNTWFGLQGKDTDVAFDAVLKLTDAADPDFPTADEIVIDLLNDEGGWALEGPDGWDMKSATQDTTFVKNTTAHGSRLKAARFANVIESMRVALWHFGSNSLVFEIDRLEELLNVRAIRYWTEQSYDKPVYMIRKLNGEANLSYFPIYYGRITKPATISDITELQTGVVRPIGLTLERMPFNLGAIPGQEQADVTMKAQQTWEYDLDWVVSPSTDLGQNNAFVENDEGELYLGAASGILKWSGATWATETTTPVTLTNPITAAYKLEDGTLLFGDNGQIVSLDTSGTWAVETSLPTGQVRAIWESSGGFVYAADDARIIKRDKAGTWAEDDTLPTTNVEALFEESRSKRMLAGETGQILRVKDEIEANPIEILLEQINGSFGEQYGTKVYVEGVANDADPFNENRLFFRFENVTIPQGAIINTAYITFTARRNRSGSTETIRIYGEDVDNSTVLTGVDDEIADKTKTSRSKKWSTSTKWKRNRTYDTPSLRRVVQEVVDRSGWSSGNAMGFIFQSNTLASGIVARWNRREAFTPQRNIGKSPVLYVEYSIQPTAGDTWEVISTVPTGKVTGFLEIRAKRRILALGDSELLASHNKGRTWEVLHDSSTFPNQLTAIGKDKNGILYIGDSAGVIYRSTDEGSGWEIDNNTIGSNIGAIYGEDDGDIWAGDTSQVLTLGVTTPLTLGIDETTEDRVFVANHHKVSNLTHAYTHVATVWSRVFPQTSFPFDLLPGAFGVGDSLYMGNDTTLPNTGPFNNVLFNIGQILVMTGGSITLNWEYWNGSTWAALSVHDETSGFTLTGYGLVSWHVPSDWATTAVNGVTGYWVRVNCSAKTGTLTSPAQETIDIFSVITSYLELDSDQAEGTIASLMRLELNNRSSAANPGGGGVALYSQRAIMGVKSVSGHEKFRAFLNFADEQNPDGVTVASEHAAATLVNDIASPTGRAVFIDATSVSLNTMADRASITIDTDTARDYYGKYRLYLRGHQSGGSAGEVKVQAKIVSGAGGVNFLSDRQVWRFQDDHYLLEFDEIITLPTSSAFLPSDIGDETKIIIRTEHEQNDADLTLYDAWLLPVDLSYVDSQDLANSNNSANGPDAKLLVDSISTPKVDIRTIVKHRSSDLIKATYLADSGGDSGGEFTIPKAQAVRIWILTARHAGAVGTTTWVSEPEVTHSAKAVKVDRWLFGRGLA